MELSEDVTGLIWAVVVLFVFTTKFKNVLFASEIIPTVWQTANTSRFKNSLVVMNQKELEDVTGLIGALVVLFVFSTKFKNVVFTMYAYIALNIVGKVGMNPQESE